MATDARKSSQGHDAATPFGVDLIVSPRADGSDEQVVANYEHERTATIYARDYVSKGYRAWLREGRVRWEITAAVPLCSP